MKKIIDYRLIDRLDTNRLETEICSLLEDGWQLYGSPLMSGGGNDYVQKSDRQFWDMESPGK